MKQDMFENTDLSTLEARPKWWVPRVFMWLSVITFLLSVLLGIVSFVTMVLDTLALGGNNDIFIDLSVFAGEAFFIALYCLFYVGILWLASLIADKIDQLVWLNANQVDRQFIYNKRVKNVKNQ